MQKTQYKIFHSKIGGDDLLIYSDNNSVALPTDEVTGLHYHNRCEIGLCKCGHGIWVTSDHIYALSPGDVVISPAGIPHYSRCCSTANQPECRCDFLYFDEERLLEGCGIRSKELLDGNRIVSPVVLTWNSNNNLRNLLEKMVTAFREAKNKALADRICAHWYSLFLLELRVNQFQTEPTIPIPNDELAPALQKLIVDFSSDISVKELADLCSFSTGYFINSFKKVYGVSPIRWLNRFRVNIAAQLLAESDISVTDIGGFVGFSSPSDFYRHFTAIHGMSPSAYRSFRDTKH